MMNARWRWLVVAPVVAVLGCSDPVPPPAQAGLHLSVGLPLNAVDQMGCPGTGTYDIGAPDAPTAQLSGEPVIDGTNGATISCSVRGSGPYTFSSQIQGTTPQGNRVTLVLSSGTIGADQATGSAMLNVFTTQLGGTFTSSQPCTFNIVNKNIKGGSLWATFTCPSITQPPSGLCGINQSVIVLQNCDGS